MRLYVSHPLSVAPDAALAAALDAATLTRVPEFMPMVASATRVERTDLGGGRVRVVDRFAPAFDPPSFARGLTKDMLGWDLRLTWDLATRAAEFVIDPHVKDAWKRYADVGGVYRIEARGGGCARVIEGSLTIHVALLGALAERFAVRLLTDQFAGEARLLEASARAATG
jgi:hypothetical protein